MCRVSTESWVCSLAEAASIKAYHSRGDEKYLLQQVGGTSAQQGWWGGVMLVTLAVNDTGQRSHAHMTSMLQSTCQSITKSLSGHGRFLLAIVSTQLWVSLCISQVTEEWVEASPCGSQCGHVSDSDFQIELSQSHPFSKNLVWR